MKKHPLWLRLLPLALLLLGLAAFFYFRLYEYLNWEILKTHRAALLNITRNHPILVPLIFIGVYTVIVAISVPYATFLTILGGFLFGLILGTLYVVFSATLGAAIVFFAAKTAFRGYFQQKAKPFTKKLEKNIQKNALSYLFFLRLVPLFPFWLINILPALLGVSFRTYLITTFFGIIPGTAVYVYLGNNLGIILDWGGTPDLSIIFEPVFILPIIALALLVLLPLLYRKFQKD